MGVNEKADTMLFISLLVIVGVLIYFFGLFPAIAIGAVIAVFVFADPPRKGG